MATVLLVGTKVVTEVERKKEFWCVRSSRCPSHVVTKKKSVLVSLKHNNSKRSIQRASEGVGGTNWPFGLELWNGSWSISPISRSALISVYSCPFPYLSAQHLLPEPVPARVGPSATSQAKGCEGPPKGPKPEKHKGLFTLLEKKQQCHVPCLLGVLVSTRQGASLFLDTGLQKWWKTKYVLGQRHFPKNL